METPSERLYKAALEKFKSETGSASPEAETADRAASAAEFPSEPFQCPACGQLLAPACRVCVACKHIIDPAEIARTPEVVSSAARAPSTEPKPQSVRFPWRIFLAVLAFAFFLGLIYSTAISFGLLKVDQAELALRSVPMFAGVWVFFDALRRGVRRPLRWAVGTMLILIVVLPWYLARRKEPRSTVPFIEAEVGPVARVLLIAILLFILASLIFYIVQGPQPASTPTPAPKIQKSGNGSQARVNDFDPGNEHRHGRWRGEGRGGSLGVYGPQAFTKAPSDARQT